jgi:galactokinase
MPNVQETIRFLEDSRIKSLFSRLYGKEETLYRDQVKRYQNLLESYCRVFPDEDLEIFSTPGRTEIGGNHTDHNHGRVLAASVNLDSIAAASRIGGHWITVHSEGYETPFRVSLNDLDQKKEEEGTTTALIRGIAARLKELGYHIGGFNACISSQVLVGSGLSSSASIEVLICTIFNTLYNQGKISPETMALIGQYAENRYFNKPCGLMDQMTCAVGGIITIDFKNPENPVVKKVPFDFNTMKMHLLVVDTGGSHADLTDDYASVPEEMRFVAKLLGTDVLRGTNWNLVCENLSSLRKKSGDRAILRAFHFFMDNQRVSDQVLALESDDFATFLKLVNESGNSSFKWLQNCYTTKDPSEQGVSLALALTEQYLKESGKGACRVHGGGFRGTIQVFMPDELLNGYIQLMRPVFGENAIMVLNIRPVGTVHINSLI